MFKDIGGHAFYIEDVTYISPVFIGGFDLCRLQINLGSEVMVMEDLSGDVLKSIRAELVYLIKTTVDKKPVL